MNKKFAASSLLLLFTLNIPAFSQPISCRNLLFEDDFSNPTSTQKNWQMSVDSTYQIKNMDQYKNRGQIVDAPGLTGMKAFTFIVPHTQAGLYRSELSLDPKAVPSARENGLNERWYGAKIYIPSNWDTTSPVNGEDIVLQWHALIGKERVNKDFPNLSISVKKNSWQANIAYGNPANIQRNKFDLAPFLAGSWSNWVIHAKWAMDNTGLIQIWKDGLLVFNQSGQNVYTLKRKRTPYLKTGIYHAKWRDTQTLIRL